MSTSTPLTAKHIIGPASALQAATHDTTQSALHSMRQTMHHDMHHDMHQDTTHTMHQDMHQVVRQETTHVNNTPPSPEEVGLRWSGYDGAYLDIASGRVLSWQESKDRLGR